MPLDTAKADLVLQCALLLAGEEDDFADRQLGPIHLVKYVYLADLAYALRNQGVTYTGARWTFYKFGPWASEIHARIEPALLVLNADKRTFESDFPDREDWVRWSLQDEDALQRRERALPFEIKMELRRNIHRFGHDTAALLDYVYKTRPMLHAAPGEELDFVPQPLPSQRAGGVAHSDALSRSESTPRTARQQKKLRERMQELRERSQAKPAGTGGLVTPAPPRYDDIFAAGVEWLDSLAGPAIPERTVTAEFAVDVWKSPTRNGEELP